MSVLPAGFGLLVCLLPCLLSAAEPTPLPSLAVLFADPAFDELQISPDGKYFGVIAPVEGQNQVITMTSDKSQALFRFTFRDSGESVQTFQWLKDNDLLMQPATVHGWSDVPTWYGDLLVASVDGKRYRFVYGYRAGDVDAGSHLHKVTGIKGWGTLLSDLPNDPEHILIASTPWTTRNESIPSVLKVRLRDAKSWPVIEAPRANATFLASPMGEVRYASAVDAGAVEHIFENQLGHWQEVAENSERKGAMTPVGVSADGKTVFFLSDAGAATNGLFALNIETKATTLVYRNDQDNIGGIELDPYTGEVLWLAHASDNTVQFINAGHPISKARQMLDKAFPGMRLGFTSITRDYKKAIFHIRSDRDPGAWYSFDTTTRVAQFEFEANPNLSPDSTIAMQPITLKARDGLALTGFYTAQANATKTKPPMVLLVHGGPHSQDEWEFNPEVQMLATRGYAVLQVNFRGSTGFGRDFELAGRGQWGRAMQDDLTDATRWAIEQGMADPARICIMGGSYGGYASLMGLVREPDLYRCGIDLYGPTDLEEMFEKGDVPDSLSGLSYLNSALGTDKKEWDARSPIKLVDRIKAPVLIIAGGQDKRVPINHSEWMEKALRKAGKPVETLFIDSEGHGFYKLEHRIEAYQKVLDFLQKHLGPGLSG